MTPSLRDISPSTVARGALAGLARWLLHDVELVVAGAPARMLSVEAYLSAPWHDDPFAHRSLTQASWNTWYLHRTGIGYCGGSYKGLDLTFGGPDVFGGLLVRALELPDGRVIDGPSLIVDHVLAATGLRRAFELDCRLISRLATDPGGVLHLRPASSPCEAPILATARVGLTLRRAAAHPSMLAWWLRPLRFTTAPGRLRKATLHEAAALILTTSATDAEIAGRIGARPHTVRGWRAAVEEGRREGGLEALIGTAPSGRALARAHGAWWARYAVNEASPRDTDR